MKTKNRMNRVAMVRVWAGCWRIWCLVVCGCWPSPGAVAQQGTLDSAFAAKLERPGTVRAVVSLTDGQVLLGGSFSSVNDANRIGLARVSADGVLDPTFAVVDGPVDAIAVQSNGQILVGGGFLAVNGVARRFLARLNPDGSLDERFNADLNGGVVNAIVVQQFADGTSRILVGGRFSSVGDKERQGIARLLDDGSLDATFSPGSAFGRDGEVFALAALPNGQVYVGGNFDRAINPPRRCLAQLKPNGDLDSSFDPGLGFDSIVTALALDGQGRILVGGWFRHVNGYERLGIARLNHDGGLDLGFVPADLLYAAYVAFAVQEDGRILVGGDLLTRSSPTRVGVVRLLDDGRLDPTFARFADDHFSVSSMTLQPDGKLVVGLYGFGLNMTNQPVLARLNLDDPPVLRLVNARLDERGSFHLDLWASGPWPETVVIESSVDLDQWAPVATNLTSGGAAISIPEGDITGRKRFFRVRIP